MVDLRRGVKKRDFWVGGRGDCWWKEGRLKTFMLGGGGFFLIGNGSSKMGVRFTSSLILLLVK